MKKLAALFCAAALVISSILPQIGGMQTNAETVKYQIYPIPHSVTYAQGITALTSKANIVVSDGIDAATRGHIKDVLKENGISASFSKAEVPSQTNIFVAVQGKKSLAADFLNKNGVTHDYTKNDAYALCIKNGIIAVVGKNTDSAFYGVTTLQQIFSQCPNHKVQNLTILDYASIPNRGFIEGYYGIPWSNENRKSLMEFGSRFKANTYVFAPKDDPYHNSRWRELYPPEELKKIKDLADTGNRTKCRFVWSIHPFMRGRFNFNNYEHDKGVLLAKFNQLYGVGVRQFGILADDVGAVNRDDLLKLLNDVVKWMDKKGDVYNLLFCPAGYNNAWQSGDGYQELKKLNLASPRVHIFWTGNAVFSCVSQDAVDHFVNGATTKGHPGRKPYFWLNWPVNDNRKNRLIMGPGNVLIKGVKNLDGVVTNPMPEAQASKVGIFAVADYTWNNTDFDAEKSWKKSFKYIEPNASEELHEICKHLVDKFPDVKHTVFKESRELAPKLEDFSKLLQEGNKNKIETSAKELIKEYEKISSACEEFMKKSKNTELKAEMKPWVQSLEKLSQATINYLKAIQAFYTGKVQDVWQNYSQGCTKYAQSQNCPAKVIGGPVNAEAGSQKLVPFAKSLAAYLDPKVKKLVNDGNIPQENLTVTPITNIKDGAYSGKLSNIADGKDNTFMWFNHYVKKGDYVGLAFNKPIDISSIEALMGTGTNSDTFSQGKLQYSTDGAIWKDATDKIYTGSTTRVQASNLQIKAKYVRYLSLADAACWLAVREIRINSIKPTANETGFYSQQAGNSQLKVAQGRLSNLTDGSADTYVTFKHGEHKDYVDADAYVGVDLQKTYPIGKIHILQGRPGAERDTFGESVLEYSTDGKKYLPIKNVSGSDITLDTAPLGIQARYIRLRNIKRVEVWASFKEFTVSIAPKPQKVFTNQEDLRSVPAVMGQDRFSIAQNTSFTLRPGKYIGLDLNKIRQISSLQKDIKSSDSLKLESSKNNIVYSEVKEMPYDIMRYIRLKNTSDKPVTVTIHKFEVNTVEYKPVSVDSTNYTDTERPLQGFDGNLNTLAWLKNSQFKGKYIIYDLGQPMNLHSLKFICNDSEHDFPRHAKISLSMDKKSWSEVMHIDGTTNDPDDISISQALPTHEGSYNITSVKFTPMMARYLKFEITENKKGSDKWVRFNEIELNDGAYFPETNMPQIEVSGKQTKKYSKDKMLDGKLTTGYKPANTNVPGSVIYYIDNAKPVKTVTILSDASSNSNARVSFMDLDGKWKMAGRLNQGLKRILTGTKPIQAIKIDWKNNAPLIYELLTSEKELPPVSDNAKMVTITGKGVSVSALDSTLKNVAGVERTPDTVNPESLEGDRFESVNVFFTDEYGKKIKTPSTKENYLVTLSAEQKPIKFYKVNQNSLKEIPFVYDAKAKTISFQSSSLGKYVMVYKLSEPAISEKPQKLNSSKSTNQNNHKLFANQAETQKARTSQKGNTSQSRQHSAATGDSTKGIAVACVVALIAAIGLLTVVFIKRKPKTKE